MNVRLHPHAQGRLTERGATEAEVIATVETGERFPAKWGRTGFRRNFIFNGEWQGRQYGTKQVEAYAVEEEGWLGITIIVRKSSLLDNSTLTSPTTWERNPQQLHLHLCLGSQ